jgi:hypothetical protein
MIINPHYRGVVAVYCKGCIVVTSYSVLTNKYFRRRVRGVGLLMRQKCQKRKRWRQGLDRSRHGRKVLHQRREILRTSTYNLASGT